jgi:TPR repeat protein
VSVFPVHILCQHGLMRTLFSVLLLAVLATPAHAQNFKTGLDAYDRGDFETALTVWQPLAERGDARAQFNLGVIHFNAQSVPHDPAKAVQWYRAAADQGYGPAQASLAFMYETGQGVLQNYINAYKWLTLAQQHGVEGGEETRETLATKMTVGQIAEAQQAAADWRPLIAETTPDPRGETGAQAAVVALPEQVRKAQRLLGELGFDVGPTDGIAGPRTRAAIRDYQDRNGLPDTGVITVGLIAQLETRKSGGEPDQSEREIVAREPEEAPTPTPPARVAEKPPVRAQDCDRLAAHPDDVTLPSNVTGVPFQNIDAGRAVEACELALAVNAGDPRYQLQLARSLHKADRIEEAVTYYQQAGLQGHPLAQKSLGFAYANGLGVTQDYTKAAQWHHMAADQGDSDAQHNLGYLYAGGRGVDLDFVQAHMWYNIAAALGSAGAAGQRDLLAGRMTNRQIAEAEARALSWFDLHGIAVEAQ